MNRFATLTLCCAAALSLSAQSFKVITKEGETVGFNNENIERIEFTDKNLPSKTEKTPVEFNDILVSVDPPEGIIDTEANPIGLGCIILNLNGRLWADPDSGKEIVLSRGSEEIFRRRANDEGMHVFRDALTSRTEFRYVIDYEGYLVPGAYSLYIPEGIYFDHHDNPITATTRVFYLPTPPPAQSVTATPDEGAVQSLKDISFRYYSYPVVESTADAKAGLYKDDMSALIDNPAISVSADGTVNITLTEEFTEAGVYKLVIDEGSLALRTEEGGMTYANQEVILLFEITGGKQLDPKPGDYYYSDGSWCTFPVKRDGAHLIGIVFYVGPAITALDYPTYYTVKDGSKPLSDFHGYVLALRDATYYDGEHHPVIWSFWDEEVQGCGCSTATDDFLGYNNTKAIKARADRDFGGLSDSGENFPATYYATVVFEESEPAPAQSSGWFLPSAGQINYIYPREHYEEKYGATSAFIEKSMKALPKEICMPMFARDSRYWTSTEVLNSYKKAYRAVCCNFDKASISPGGAGGANKDTTARVRAILAF